MKGWLGTAMRRAETNYQTANDREPTVVPLPDTLDRLRQAAERERSHVVNEDIEIQRLDIEYAKCTAEYFEIRTDIIARRAVHLAQIEKLQMQMIELLKSINLRAKIVPLKVQE